jgi:hypothetical protein
MKFIYLGYFDEKKWDGVPEHELNAFMDACFAYDDELRRNGHPNVGEALQPSRHAVTLRFKNGKVLVTDGPYAETKEQLGGYGIVEAPSLEEAIRIIVAHPALKDGMCEVRPVADLSEMIRESERRRSVKQQAASSARAGKMTFVCLGYTGQQRWASLPPGEVHALIDECVTYDDELRKKGHFVGGEALASARCAKTIRGANGNLSITDGPYAETKEQIGGILVLAANDLDHAIELMSQHPGVKAGPFEIRPADDLEAMKRASEQRRAAATASAATGP